MIHTPGPWTWNRDETAMQEFRGYSITGPDGLVIIPPEAIQNEANARLIASAPSLLAALEDIAAFENLDENEVERAHAYQAVSIARAAVAKATRTETTDA